MSIRELTIVRIFDAPRELVFKMWTDPIHLARWWGPKGFTNPVCELDVRPGGAIRVHMQAPDGLGHPMGGEFKEILPPRRLVFTTTAFEGEDGTPQLQNLNTVTFEEQNGRTKVTLHVAVQIATPAVAGPLSGMEQGWNQSLDRLADLLTAR